jgi:hypothetical protein
MYPAHCIALVLTALRPAASAVVQDAALPEGCRKFVRDTLTSLLMCPPPYGVAASTRKAVRQLSEW